jgi:hypothetical protein
MSMLVAVKNESYAFPHAHSFILGYNHDMDGLTGSPAAPVRIVDIACAQFRLIRRFLGSSRAAKSQLFHR